MPKSDIPEGLDSTARLLTDAYPNGLPDQDYLPLLLLLSEEMSERALGEIVALLFERERVVVQNDAAAAQSVNPPSPEETERVRQHLHNFGYEEWTREV